MNSRNTSTEVSQGTMEDSSVAQCASGSSDANGIDFGTSRAVASSASVQTKRLFAECALVEIIHLHDCLRGALQNINKDVDSLVAAASVIQIIGQEEAKTESSTSSASKNSDADSSHTFDINGASELSYSVASRFHLIWSVFQAHSGAEDEFIWPALKMKIESKKQRACAKSSNAGTNNTTASASNEKSYDSEIESSSHSLSSTGTDQTGQSTGGATSPKKCGCESILEQEAYEEDHAEEETMFKQINTTLRRLNGSFRYYHANRDPRPTALTIIKKVILLLKEQTDHLTQHLTQHLQKEETQCLPMVKKHLSNDEISELVGNIMGKRSAEMMGKILNLAVCSLPQEEREDMVRCLKKAMGGTFFEKWLTMGGWNGNVDENRVKRSASSSSIAQSEKPPKRSNSFENEAENTKKRPRFQGHISDARLRYPSRYYIKENGKTILAWNNTDPNFKSSYPQESVPKFTQSELTPTFRFSDSGGGMVLGCEHYSRGCKLRHPDTGQLFTCRLCCEEVRQRSVDSQFSLPMLDRHQVSEVYCMKCFSVQPAGDYCVNKECGEKFANYSCTICNLYENDKTKKIYHCPYCNVCRKGEGLGIDFRHCMRCNACISIDEFETHSCIPQSLQGNCAICKESMFESTEPLRAMKCGHVMHLSCYNQYAYRSSFMKITCPTCRKVFDNMRG